MSSTAITFSPSARPILASFAERSFVWVMGFFIFITIFLPGGSINGFNFKLPIYLALLPLALMRMFKGGLVTSHQLAVCLAVPTLFSGWVVIGVVNGFAAAGCIRQYMDLVLVLFLCWLVSLFCAGSEAGRLRFMRLVVNSATATAIFKIGLIAYSFARGISTAVLVADLFRIFGVGLITLDLTDAFSRVQFVSDGLIPICLYVVLRYRRRLGFGLLRSLLTFLLLTASVAFSFSRYFWAYSALAMVLGVVFGQRDRLKVIVAVTLGVAVAASLPLVSTILELRFSNDVAGYSDSIRVEQSAALKQFFNEAPILGHGFGSFTNQVVRQEADDPTLNYGYEEQLLALCGQIGLLGIAALALLFLYANSDLWWKSRLPASERISIAILTLAWVSAGFYNPLLFHPIAGINYSMFLVLQGLRPDEGASPAKTSNRLGVESSSV